MTLRVTTGETETDQMAAMLDRLAALSATLGSLGEGAAPKVMEQLARMEKRDVHAIAAIDTFATALKSVSQHLAHVRQAVQQDNVANAAKLDEVARQLADMEARFSEGLAIDFAPMSEAFDTIAERLAGLEAKLDTLPQQQTHWPFDADAFAGALASIVDRLARVESKLDSVAQQPALEPQATADLLSAIAARVSRVEDKVDSGADGTSIAACLLAVDRRLSRIEGGLGMDRPLPAAEEIPHLSEVVHSEPEQAPAPEPLPEDGRERVDVLLEQVFKVLAR
jgi:hypothetical protein